MFRWQILQSSINLWVTGVNRLSILAQISFSKTRNFSFESQRSIIKLLFLKGQSATRTYWRLVLIVLKRLEAKMSRCFKQTMSIDDQWRLPVVWIWGTKIHCRDQRGFLRRQNLNKGSVGYTCVSRVIGYKFITQVLKMRKMSKKWISRNHKSNSGQLEMRMMLSSYAFLTSRRAFISKKPSVIYGRHRQGMSRSPPPAGKTRLANGITSGAPRNQGH